MATVPGENLEAISMPLFYKDLTPINSEEHGNYHARVTDKATWMANTHAIPLTAEEFPQAQRHYPIVFSSGADAVPLALMGLNEGVNVFLNEDGSTRAPVYMPAYARRYPYLLAKLSEGATELSLCFDPTCDLLGEFDDGVPLFEDGKASEPIKATLKFCEQFEIAAKKTTSFVAELNKHNLLMDGELAMSVEGREEPFIYRGFRMVNEEKLREVRGDVLRTWNQNGILALIYAHMFSLELVREVFTMQVEQGKGPVPPKPAAN